jgi:hypothetical protein
MQMSRKMQYLEISTELTQMFELADNDIKTVIVTVFHMFKKLCRNIKEKFESKSNF